MQAIKHAIIFVRLECLFDFGRHGLAAVLFMTFIWTIRLVIMCVYAMVVVVVRQISGLDLEPDINITARG